jgi:hypothetical protein
MVVVGISFNKPGWKSALGASCPHRSIPATTPG